MVCIVRLIVRTICGVFLLAQAVHAEHTVPLSVGVVVPLSGPMAPIGRSIQVAIDYAINQETLRPLVVFEDDQFQPKLTVAAVRKLVAVDKVRALIIFGSPTCLSVADELERKGVPTICISIHEAVTKNKSSVFRLFPSAASLAETTVAEVIRRNYLRVSVASDMTDGLLSVSHKFIEKLPKERLVSNQEINPSETDLKPYVARILRDKPDAVFLMLLPQHFGPLVSQLMTSGYTGEIFNAVSLANTTIQKQVFPVAPKAWYVFFDNTKAEKTLKNIEHASSHELDAEGILGYEALRLLQAIKDKKDLAAGLREMKVFHSMFGDISPQGQDFFIPVAVNTFSENNVQR